jgi:hypothetical protein
MCSTPDNTSQTPARQNLLRTGTALLIFCGLMLTGCQHYAEPDPDRLVATPMTIDPAIQKRDAPPLRARYTNTATVAGPRGFNYQPADDLPDYQRPVAEPLLAIGQIFWLPVDLLVNPQWEGQAYYPVRTEPTYHGVPALDVNRDSRPN